MIKHILIKNIALIDELSIEFYDGFNVLTGETGAGKSIIIDSVNLALGERADRELIKSGQDYARVEVLFSLSNPSKVNEILSSYGIEPEPDGSLLLMRELTVQGKNVCRINGRTVTLSMLREITRHLVDIHGQHQHQYLLDPESHIDFLDKYCGPVLDAPKQQLADTYDQWLNVRREISRIEGINKDGVRRKDILIYQINEINNAHLRPGEEEELRKERTLLMHAEKIMHAANESYVILYTGKQGSPSVSDKLAEAVSLIKAVENIDDSLDSIAAQLENVQYTLEDVVMRLREFKDRFEYDPYRLEEIEERLQLIQNLKRKYGSSIEEILRFKAELENELSLIENSEERLAALKSQSDALFSSLLRSCKEVSNIRKQKAKELEKELVIHLCDLNMDKTRFQISIQTPDAADIDNMSSSMTKNGFDKVEFLISPNPGEPLKPLAKIISGGEMSRVMLAFKTLLADIDEIPTMIFDEIDVGVSGRTAQKVAEKIGTISKGHQVICVTHLPQIASMADNHYLIEKVTKNNQTKTLVSKLEQLGRQKEIARMIGGSEITKLSLDHAGELINNAVILKNKY